MSTLQLHYLNLKDSHIRAVGQEAILNISTEQKYSPSGQTEQFNKRADQTETEQTIRGGEEETVEQDTEAGEDRGEVCRDPGGGGDDHE